MVLFGASGDLTRRKLMPALWNLECAGLLPRGFRVLGFARTRMDGDEFRRRVRSGLAEFSRAEGAENEEGEQWRRFAGRLDYIAGDYDSPESHAELARRLAALPEGCGARPLYYFALPPDVVETALRCMAGVGLAGRADRGPGGARVMIEKPFGHDLQSAQRLNGLLAGLFDERHTYRIDHYLAKDAVRSLLVLRFANAVFEPVWNREHVDSVQITAAEDLGVEGRGSYYDAAGVVRDMIQNHVMQVLALVAMEPPVAGDAESVRDRKLEVFRSIATLGASDFVFGQYRGYREEPKVSPRSGTPTFAAARLCIENWRWSGVPFYVRSGKALARKVTEVVVRFRRPPLCVFERGDDCAGVEPNSIVLRIQPEGGARLSVALRRPGLDERVAVGSLDFHYADLGGSATSGYERVLLEGMRGEGSIFWRADAIEASWRVVAPLIEVPPEDLAPGFPNYDPGSWGPPGADELLGRDGRAWAEPY
jgi:glucose-6-phosphate 1-dehydrogenase